QAVIERLQNIVGRSYVLTDDQSTRQYRQGRRFGEGKVLAVVVPGTLLEQWQVLQAAIEADCIVIMQAANTGLTGGSTPYGDDYDRPVLVMSTRRLKGIQVIHDGKQVICLPGATLDNLEQILKGYNREPHSVIGSSCIGASVLGGVCNNSGGALVRRGPAYTELALYAQVNAAGQLELVNHLGVNLGSTPEEILTRLEKQQYQAVDILDDNEKQASDHRYAHDVTQVDEDTP
ncbi:FAD-binding protein, partial [Acinetobacter baumannii]